MAGNADRTAWPGNRKARFENREVRFADRKDRIADRKAGISDRKDRIADRKAGISDRKNRLADRRAGIAIREDRFGNREIRFPIRMSFYPILPSIHLSNLPFSASANPAPRTRLKQAARCAFWLMVCGCIAAERAQESGSDLSRKYSPREDASPKAV
jgi:hypothetical protein